MSCPHGNHIDACDMCDEVAAAYNSGVEHTKQGHEWVGLTNEEREECVSEYYRWAIADAVEAKLKEKNT